MRYGFNQNGKAKFELLCRDPSMSARMIRPRHRGAPPDKLPDSSRSGQP